MTHEQIEPERADADLAPEVEGTAGGSPVDGVEMSEEEHETAVEPDDNAFEVDGPQAGHA